MIDKGVRIITVNRCNDLKFIDFLVYRNQSVSYRPDCFTSRNSVIGSIGNCRGCRCTLGLIYSGLLTALRGILSRLLSLLIMILI